jgi:hypothetical protein
MSWSVNDDTVVGVIVGPGEDIAEGALDVVDTAAE